MKYWLLGAGLAASFAAAAPQSSITRASSESVDARVAGMMASYSETESFVFFNFVVNEYKGDKIVRQSYCTETSLDLDTDGGKIESECFHKEMDIDIIEGKITFENFEKFKASKGMSRPMANFFYRLDHIESERLFLLSFRKPKSEQWSNDIEVKSNEWDCEPDDGLIKCLWSPEKVDMGGKRNIIGF